ncbi:MlaD family protein [Fibrobacter sp.]|uniref:MlaD family protein n=1 Tax=Fibrobacter sp. TaxID=35828 RepID=UPI0025C27BEF|nr:MlaD family protein [Fibrobacter sp.]MBR3072562.1 MCE family protein [Fibrobacter sp.]
METTRSERIKLGAFMLFCGVLICVFLGYVLKRYLSEQFDNYYTIFDTDVNGLFVDAKVKLNGISVGSVTSITINEKDLNQVVVAFKVQRGTPIKVGTRAGMTAGMNLTGEKQVILSGGDFNEPNVPEGGLVPASVSMFDQITGKVGDAFGKVMPIIDGLNRLLTPENAESISRTLANLEKTTENLSRLTADIRKPLNTMSKSAVSLQKILAEVEEAKLAAKADASLSTLKEKLEAIDTKGLNDNLMQTAESMNKLSQNVDAMVYRNQDQVGNAVEELNTILENLEEFTQKIKNNPSVLIRSEGKSGR